MGYLNSNTYRNTKLSDLCFSKSDLKSFNKYKKWSKRFVYKRNNKLVGEVWITPVNKLEDEIPFITSNGYYISGLCVHPRFRNQGIASELMDHIIRYSHKKELLHLILQISQQNEHLLEFYRDFGFTDIQQGFNIEGVRITFMMLGL